MLSGIGLASTASCDIFTEQINTSKNCSDEFIELLNEEASSPGDKPLGEDKLIGAWFVRVGNSFVGGNVLWSKNSSDNNPIMIVKGTDIDWTPLKIEVEIKNVNLKNASITEMIALNGYLTEKGFTPLPIQDRLSSSGEMINYFTDGYTKYDFLTVIMDFIENQRFHENWQCYMPLNTTIEALKNMDIL